MVGAIVLALVSITLVTCALGTIAFAWWQTTRPLTPTDEWCSRVDVDLDELRAEGSIRHYVGGGWRT